MNYREEAMQLMIEKALNEKDPDKRALKELKRDLVQILIKYCEPNPGATETYADRQAHFMIAMAEFLGMNLGGVIVGEGAHEVLIRLFEVAAAKAGLDVRVERRVKRR
jgi:hypothetical protein